MKEPSECEVLNDVNGELVNLYRVVQHHLKSSVSSSSTLVSRQIYAWEQMKVPATLTDIQRAARFFYLQKTSFGGRTEGQTFGTSTTGGPRFNLLRVEEDLSMAHLRLASVVIEHLDWHDVVEKYDRPHTLFFMTALLDTEGYGVEFGRQDTMQWPAWRAPSRQDIITINDHPEMLKAFEGLPMDGVPITYQVAGANSQGAQELIIRSSEEASAVR